jgi:hypothetical protein
MILGPNVNQDWSPEDIWNTGFLKDYGDSLGVLTVEKFVFATGI